MCLFTDNPIPKIAKTPIRVWKNLRKFQSAINGSSIYRTPHMDTPVKIGEILQASLTEELMQYQTPESTMFIVDIQGVHAFISRKSAILEEIFLSHGIVTEWEIPAGAKYWIGNGCSKNEIAATEMKFIKVCEN